MQNTECSSCAHTVGPYWFPSFIYSSVNPIFLIYPSPLTFLWLTLVTISFVSCVCGSQSDLIVFASSSVHQNQFSSLVILSRMYSKTKDNLHVLQYLGSVSGFLLQALNWLSALAWGLVQWNYLSQNKYLLDLKGNLKFPLFNFSHAVSLKNGLASALYSDLRPLFFF